MLNKRNFALVIIAIFACITGYGAISSSDGTFTLTFTKTELKEKIDKQIAKRAETDHKVDVQGVDVDLTSDKVGLDIQASTTFTVPITHKELDVAIKANTVGMLDYNPENYSFYFKTDTLHLKEFEVNGKNAGEKVNGLIDRFVKNTDKNEAYKARVQETTDKYVKKAVDRYLKDRPVYTFKDDLKGTVARVGLQDVHIEKGELKVKVSFLKLTGWVISMAIMAIALVVAGIALVVITCFFASSMPFWLPF